MSFASEWADLLNWEIVIKTRTGADSFGNDTWSAGTTVSAHVDSVEDADPRPSSQEGEASGPATTTTIYVEPLSVSPGDLVVLPDGTTMNVATITRHYYGGEVHHIELGLDI